MGALCFLLLAAGLATGQQAPPQLSFAVLADVQYGDQPTAGKREYRKSLPKLREAVEVLNTRKDLAFAIHLGDLIDFRAAAGWRFVVLDGMDLSVATGSRPQGSPEHTRGREMLDALVAQKTANAVNWNGGMGERQLDWLRDVLKRASSSGERVIAFCHFPVLRESSTPAHLLWNHDALRQILESHPAVAGWFNGHDHNGGYAERNGIHYVTFPGLVESGEQTSHTLVRVYPDRLELEGAGTAPTRTLRIIERR